MYDRILFPTDGSDGSKRAERIALDLAEQFGSELYALHVVDTTHFSEPALSSMELPTDEAEDLARELLREIAESGEQRNVTVTSHHCHGAPADEILDYADEIDAALVVMGYQGHNHRRKMGSVVERVLRGTDRQVLAV